MRFGHYGSYNINLGDNIALLNVRRYFDKYIDNIDWIKINFDKYKKIKDDNIINIINNLNIDVLIIGGGGLIEERLEENPITYRHLKVTLNKKIIQNLNCKVFFISVGINIFRGLENFCEKSKEELSDIIEYSNGFSLRNDGSLNFLNKKLNINNEKIKVLPDPGLLFNECKENKSIIETGFFQIALNSNKKINKKRCGETPMNVYFENIRNIVNNYNLKILPHTKKDYNLKKKNIELYQKIAIKYHKKLFNYNKTLSFIKKNYMEKADYIVAMRGHGQLISIGLNIPGIYFSTQDKVEQFSLLNGFEDYNVDIKNNNYYEILNEKIKKLKEDKNYLETWYKIRNKKILLWEKDFDDYIKYCVKIILN